jgi:hypothetical protein
MSAPARVTEIGEVLTAGVQRLLGRECKAINHPQNQREQLDAAPPVEAPCRTTMELPA